MKRHIATSDIDITHHIQRHILLLLLQPTLSAAGDSVELETEYDGWLTSAQLTGRNTWPRRLEEASCFDAVSWRDQRPDFRKTLDTILPGRRVGRRMSMGAVALGWTDFSVFPSPSTPHDVAPGAHINNAAGLEVVTLSGRSFEEVDWLHGPIDGVIVAATPQLAHDILRLHAA